MADFEDSTRRPGRTCSTARSTCATPSAGTISFDESGDRQESTALAEQTATLIVRPRGWHLHEKHVRVDGEPMSGALFDFGAVPLPQRTRRWRARGTRPVFLPAEDGEPSRGARSGTTSSSHAQEALGVPRGHDQGHGADRDAAWRRSRWTRSCTSCASTPPGSTAGAGITSSASSRSSANRADFVLPDRAQVTMDAAVPASLRRAADPDLPPPRRARDGRHGGADPDQATIRRPTRRRWRKVRADKLREVQRRPRRHLGRAPGAGRRSRARSSTTYMPAPNQLAAARGRARRRRGPARGPEGAITERGLRHNIRVGVQYLEAWLAASAACRSINLMEDAATAEICRAQLWQWLHGTAPAPTTARRSTLRCFDRAR